MAIVKLEMGIIDAVGRKHGYERTCQSPTVAAETIRRFIDEHEKIGSTIGYVRVDGVPIELPRC